MSRIARYISNGHGRGARWSAVAVIVALGTLTAVAVAAKPKHGAHFVGKTAASPVNGFNAPVTFAVSKNGRSLTNFRYSSFGCLGAGGFRPGIDYYTQPGSIIKVGAVKVSASGHFSATGAVSSYTSHGFTTTTTSSVIGSFTKANAATGSITFSQKATGAFKASCGPAAIGFTATGH